MTDATPPPDPLPPDPRFAHQARSSGRMPSITRVATGRGVQWWTEGWRLFVREPWTWLAIAAIYFVLLVAVALIPVVGTPATSLLLPILAGGALVGARAVDRGQPLTVAHLFSGFGPHGGPLLIVGLLYLGGWFVAWLVTAAILVGVAGLDTLGALLSGDVLETGVAALAAIGVGTIVMLVVVTLLGVPLLMAVWFAPALVVFADVEPLAAMKASFAASLVNAVPFLVYNLLALAFALLATIPLGLGWLVLAPVLAGSVYASYVEIFGAPE